MVAQAVNMRTSMTLRPCKATRASKAPKDGAHKSGEQRDRALAAIWLGWQVKYEPGQDNRESPRRWIATQTLTSDTRGSPERHALRFA
eukprot:2476568-Pyramimonas_sp.AAC.1